MLVFLGLNLTWTSVALTQDPGAAEPFSEEALVLVEDFAKHSSPAFPPFCVEFFHVPTGFSFHIVEDLLVLSIIMSVQPSSPLFLCSQSLFPLCRKKLVVVLESSMENREG